MTYGLYMSAAGARAQSHRVDVISHNLANVDTPGFKRELAILQARHSEAIEQGEQQPGSRTLDDISGGMRLAETRTDFRVGVMETTGQPTDLALPDPNAFFVVQRDGEQLLTRAGNFILSSSGELQTQQGYPVLSTDGGPVIIDGALRRVTAGGQLEADGGTVSLALVRPGALGQLERIGENLFRSDGTVQPVPEPDRRVLSEHLERSTVTSTQALMELITASRAYESNVRMIQNQDHVLGTLLNRVLRQ